MPTKSTRWYKSGVAALVLGTAALASPQQNQLGMVFTKVPKTIEISKVYPVDVPDQSEACTSWNWESCNAACGGIAFTCTREANYVFLGCAPMCKWAVHVKITCGC